MPDIYGFPMLLVFTLSMTPLMFMYLYGAMGKLTAPFGSLELLGFAGFRKYWSCHAFDVPTVLSFCLCLCGSSNFATPMLIGEGYRTVPVLIVNQFIGELGGDSGFAAAISVCVIVFATAIFLLQKYISNKKSFVMSALNPVKPKAVTGIKSVLAHIYVYGICILLFLTFT